MQNETTKKNTVFNVPNTLSLIRVLLVPAFVATLLFMRDIEIWGIVVPTLLYILTAFTDMLDGQIARRCNLVTQFGKFIDPLADKFMVIGSQIAILVWMILRGEVMLSLVFVWVVLVILFRELAVTGLRLAVGGKVDVAASIFGKLKTVSQMVGTVVIHDVAVDDVVLALGSLEEQLGLALHLGEVIVHVYVVYHIASVAEPGSEVEE